MSVSKQWQAFLNTPIFKNLHLHHTNHHKLLLLSTTSGGFHTIDCEAPEAGLTACPTPSSPFKNHHPTLIGLLSSFHGLVCVGLKISMYDIEYSDLMLWNPLTREHMTLSKGGGYHHQCYKINGGAYSLYYWSSDDDYKLLRVTDDDDIIYIYSLRSDSWRKVVASLGRHIPNVVSQDWRPSIWLNEKLYFLRDLAVKFRSRPPLYIILRFDIETEKFTEIATPYFEHTWVGLWSFSVVRGCVHLCVGYYDSKGHSMAEIQVWRMDGDGGWTKALTYIDIPLLRWYEEPLHLMRTGHWIMHSRMKSHFYQVDLEKNVKDMISCPHGIYTGILDQKVKYIETFVSLKLYIK